MHTWQLQEAKNKFSEVIRKAQTEGPQTITKHGEDAVIVMSIKDYRKFGKPSTSLVQFMSCSPLAEYEIPLVRDIFIDRKTEF